MSTAEVSCFKKGSNSVRDDTATHTIAGCATFQGSSINCTLVADDPEPTLCGDGELIYQSASWFQSGCAHLKKIRVGTATILWFVAGETTFPSESFHDFLRLLVIYVLGAMIVMVCVYEIDEMWQVSRCLWKHLHGRRIRPIPPCAIFTRALLCQAWGVVCNYMILEFEFQAPMEPNVMELGSLVFSAMHFNAAGWMLTSRREKECLRKGHAKLLKRVAILHFGPAALKWEETKIQLNLVSREQKIFCARRD